MTLESYGLVCSVLIGLVGLFDLAILYLAWRNLMTEKHDGL